MNDKIVAFIKDNPNKYTYFGIAEIFKISPDRVRSLCTRRNIRKFVLRGKIHTEVISQENNMREPTEDELNALREECKQYGIDAEHVKMFWHKTKKISMLVMAQERPTYESVRDELVASMQKYAPKYPKIKYPKLGSHLLVVDPADVHIGKLAVLHGSRGTYDIKTAVEMAREGVNGLLAHAQGFPLERILLVIGNDILHTDTLNRTTTNGTAQNTDGTWHDAFITARKLYIEIVENLMQHAPVDVVFNPSNHDYMSGFMLADSLASWFHLSKDVTFDCTMVHRKYYQYGKNLIATTHGDGAKNADMPLLMAQEAPKMWSDTRFRYIYQHHIHHRVKVHWQSVKDYPGITLEVLRSPSAPDAWHHKHGYVGAPVAIEGFIHSKEGGQVARLSWLFPNRNV